MLTTLYPVPCKCSSPLLACKPLEGRHCGLLLFTSPALSRECFLHRNVNISWYWHWNISWIVVLKMNWICGDYYDFNFTHVEIMAFRGKYPAISWSRKTRYIEGVDGWTDIFRCFPYTDENLRSVWRVKRALSWKLNKGGYKFIYPANIY